MLFCLFVDRRLSATRSHSGQRYVFFALVARCGCRPADHPPDPLPGIGMPKNAATRRYTQGAWSTYA